MEYMTVKEAAQKWGISDRRVRLLCAEGKIERLELKGNRYLIPAALAKPIDGRTVKGMAHRKVSDILKSEKPILSFEVFPPKTGAGFETVQKATDAIAALHPAFMSVTYGAAGTTASYTETIAANIQHAHNIPAVAHLTCVGTQKKSIEAYLTRLRHDGVENILALRGDRPQDGGGYSDFAYAKDLVQTIADFGGFCIGCACYPEGHPESGSWQKDIAFLKEKVDAGCSFMTSQMFFDNDIFYNFAFKAKDKGISIPIIPGIMPVVAASQIKRICSISGTSLPPRFLRIVDKFGDNPLAMEQAGIAYATEQIIDLFANGVNAVHVYSMNRPAIARAIYDNLSEILK